MSDPIQDALINAKMRLDSLANERARIDKEIIDWKRVVDSLTVVAGEQSDGVPADVALFANPILAPLLKMSFTDGIRTVLRMANGPLSAPAIRDQLMLLDFDFSKYKQELVPIHNTLKRLEDQEEVQAIKNAQGQTVAYKWISPLTRALAMESMYGLGPIVPKVPSNIAAAISGGTETASPENQPLPKSHGRSAEIKGEYAAPEPPPAKTEFTTKLGDHKLAGQSRDGKK